jgi:acyl carrier protein
LAAAWHGRDAEPARSDIRPGLSGVHSRDPGRGRRDKEQADMSYDETLAKLKNLMKQASKAKVDWNAIGPDTAIQSLGFDSLSILDLIYDIQQEFGVEFEATELARVRTVKELVDFLEKKQG